jgi:hypothetical protein
MLMDSKFGDHSRSPAIMLLGFYLLVGSDGWRTILTNIVLHSFYWHNEVLNYATQK